MVGTITSMASLVYEEIELLVKHLVAVRVGAHIAAAKPLGDLVAG